MIRGRDHYEQLGTANKSPHNAIVIALIVWKWQSRVIAMIIVTDGEVSQIKSVVRLYRPFPLVNVRVQ